MTVISPAPDLVSSSGYHTVRWECECECGKKIIVRGKCLTQGVTKSCGCWRRDSCKENALRHGGFGTRLYTVWDSMRQRCLNPNQKEYHNYGGRGIKICSEWDDYSSFREWAYHTGYKDDAPRGFCTLDRIDVNGDYEPNNCRWVSFKVQSNNKQNTIYLTADGETRTLSEWSRVVGIKYCTLWRRYKQGWAPEKILQAVKSA